MRFKVSNEFYFGGIKKHKGDEIEVDAGSVEKLMAMRVLGEPIIEKKIERAVIEPKEKRTSESVKKTTRKQKK